MKRIAIGTDTTTAPAAKQVYQELIYSYSNIFHKPMETVKYCAFARQITFAKMKSNHGAMKEVRIVYTMIGLLNGMVIFVNVCHLVAPSISAASSYAIGIVSKNPFAT